VKYRRREDKGGSTLGKIMSKKANSIYENIHAANTHTNCVCAAWAHFESTKA